MNKKTLKALKGSIKKWEKIAAGKIGDEGDGNCPLCKLFNLSPGHCSGCPVDDAGHWGCMATPYYVFDDLEEPDVSHKTGATFAISANAKSIALEEVEFLKSLLPETSNV